MCVEMNLFFFMENNPFFWVRANTLDTLKAKNQGLHIKKYFSEGYPLDNNMLVFYRQPHFDFRILLKVCRLFRIPYIFDIDDNVWNLPQSSQDPANKNRIRYINWLNTSIKNARAVTCSTPELRDKLNKLFPEQKIFVIRNSIPGIYSAPGSILIANTDSFKLEPEEFNWFGDYLNSLLEQGFEIQFLGANDNFLKEMNTLALKAMPVMDYSNYLKEIHSGKYFLGLIPISQNEYSDCKSDIKLQEFLSADMKVITSAIAPYDRFIADYKLGCLRVLNNVGESWMKATSEMIQAEFAPEELRKNKETRESLRSIREKQLEQWFEFIKTQTKMASTLQNLLIKVCMKLLYYKNRLKGR